MNAYLIWYYVEVVSLIYPSLANWAEELAEKWENGQVSFTYARDELASYVNA